MDRVQPKRHICSICPTDGWMDGSWFYGILSMQNFDAKNAYFCNAPYVM